MLEQTVTKISFLAPDIAVATVELTMNRPDSEGGTYKNRGLRILVKAKGQWKIRTFINQRITETGLTQKEVEQKIKSK